jgi:hypothetical protein
MHPHLVSPVISRRSILEKIPKFENLARYAKLQECGFLGICVLQLWDLLWVIELTRYKRKKYLGTDMYYSM